MSDTNKRNLLYFEGSSMRTLYDDMEKWQHVNHRRLLSITIQKDGGNFCCIALTNPTEVVITSVDGTVHAAVLPGYEPSRIGGDIIQGRPPRLATTG
jgi:hypothetical protein